VLKRQLVSGLLAGALAVLLIPALPNPAMAAKPGVGTAHKKAKADFYLKDRDRIVFYGDSITDQRLYTTYIESYCVTRFPNRHFTFIHSGWGGDRVTGGGGGPIDVRLKRDVLVYKPTVVTICLGMNDGSYRAFDKGLFDNYVNGYRHILDTLTKELPGVRITLVTAPPYDDITRQPNFAGGYNSVLKLYGEAVAQLGKEYHMTVADTNAPLVAALDKAEHGNTELASKIIPDRVHPGPGGHMVMAAAVLKSWNAPEDVANIEINAPRRRVVKQDNTKVSDVKVTKEGITFTHHDASLPWPVDRDADRNKDMQLTLDVTDYEKTLNSFRLKITGLPEGKYQMKVDGADVDQLTAADLNAGIDLAAITNLPSNVQARDVLNLTRKHNDLHFKRWRQVQFPVARNGEEVSGDVKKQMDDLDAQEEEAVKQQHEAAQTKVHTVELVRMAP
jgi:lysophospholipase L1-like esterase